MNLRRNTVLSFFEIKVRSLRFGTQTRVQSTIANCLILLPDVEECFMTSEEVKDSSRFFSSQVRAIDAYSPVSFAKSSRAEERSTESYDWPVRLSGARRANYIHT